MRPRSFSYPREDAAARPNLLTRAGCRNMVGSGCTGRHGTSGVMRIGKLLPAAIIIGAIWLCWRFIVAVFVWLPWWVDAGLLYYGALMAPGVLGVAIRGKPYQRQRDIDKEQRRSHEAAFADMDRQRAELAAFEDELARREALLQRLREERRDSRLAERIAEQMQARREERR
jgi:hypothetical protein